MWAGTSPGRRGGGGQDYFNFMFINNFTLQGTRGRKTFKEMQFSIKQSVSIKPAVYR